MFLVVSGGSDTTTHIYTTSLDPLFVFPTFRNEITCISVSSQMKTICSCTHDGYMYLIDARRSTIAHSIKLGDCFPRNCLITDGWGFIFVHFTKFVEGEVTNYISMYTINAEKRFEFEIDFNVSLMSSWESKDGFDFLILASGKGQLYACEAFFASPQTIIQFADCEEPIIEVKHSDVKNEVVAITQSGIIHFFPDSLMKL